jgi:hypothetical protein
MGKFWKKTWAFIKGSFLVTLVLALQILFWAGFFWLFPFINGGVVLLSLIVVYGTYSAAKFYLKKIAYM